MLHFILFVGKIRRGEFAFRIARSLIRVPGLTIRLGRSRQGVFVSGVQMILRSVKFLRPRPGKAFFLGVAGVFLLVVGSLIPAGRLGEDILLAGLGDLRFERGSVGLLAFLPLLFLIGLPGGGLPAGILRLEVSGKLFQQRAFTLRNIGTVHPFTRDRARALALAEQEGTEGKQEQGAAHAVTIHQMPDWHSGKFCRCPTGTARCAY